jgi:two-component system, chemotaxis family, chemotaxis protein CheY
MAIPNLSAISVLVADDSPQMRRLLVAMLNAIGIWNVRTAVDGREAFDSMNAQRPDILITDADMGQVGGMELVRSVRRNHDSATPYLPIIMVTGHTERAWVEDARDAGVNEFLAKPISAGSLYSRISEVVLNPRPFVRSQGYVGPDRRRRDDDRYKGPERRGSDISVIDGGGSPVQFVAKR